MDLILSTTIGDLDLASWFHILNHLSLRDIKRLCILSKEFAERCSSDASQDYIALRQNMVHFCHIDTSQLIMFPDLDEPSEYPLEYIEGHLLSNRRLLMSNGQIFHHSYDALHPACPHGTQWYLTDQQGQNYHLTQQQNEIQDLVHWTLEPVLDFDSKIKKVEVYPHVGVGVGKGDQQQKLICYILCQDHRLYLRETGTFFLLADNIEQIALRFRRPSPSLSYDLLALTQDGQIYNYRYGPGGIANQWTPTPGKILDLGRGGLILFEHNQSTAIVFAESDHIHNGTLLASLQDQTDPGQTRHIVKILHSQDHYTEEIEQGIIINYLMDNQGQVYRHQQGYRFLGLNDVVYEDYTIDPVKSCRGSGLVVYEPFAVSYDGQYFLSRETE